VDDETGIRQFLRLALGAQRYRVLEAANGREALTVARRHAGSIDLLLTDIVMPDLNGYELAERLKVAHPETQVLYMSGYAKDQTQWRLQLSDASVLVEKPFELNGLLAGIRGMLQSPRMTSAQVPSPPVRPASLVAS
jgi:DNA-binding response OmpR family regulator